MFFDASPFCVHCSPLFWGLENIWTEDWDGSRPSLPSKCFLLTNEARCFLMLVHSVSTVALCSERPWKHLDGRLGIPVFHPSASYWPMRRDVFFLQLSAQFLFSDSGLWIMILSYPATETFVAVPWLLCVALPITKPELSSVDDLLTIFKVVTYSSHLTFWVWTYSSDLTMA